MYAMCTSGRLPWGRVYELTLGHIDSVVYVDDGTYITLRVREKSTRNRHVGCTLSLTCMCFSSALLDIYRREARGEGEHGSHTIKGARRRIVRGLERGFP